MLILSDLQKLSLDSRSRALVVSWRFELRCTVDADAVFFCLIFLVFDLHLCANFSFKKSDFSQMREAALHALHCS
jgi:hypothetical protein